ncbi:hypothetical protein BC937DRAFT_87035 [Endogone sp. FLAS-F59071]|nr:hypothetical protein BC937DRAFT_87035 [Endogone sp. FLAS-F59071]|eukprot:RUS22765.1 hypothetical protein BC937DRAFT_87035 [Endogone sp. FLAS-F59071]
MFLSRSVARSRDLSISSPFSAPSPPSPSATCQSPTPPTVRVPDTGDPELPDEHNYPRHTVDI